MKSAINVGLIVGVGLLAFGGARASLAAGIGDGQEQRRDFFSGRAAAPYSGKSGLVSPSPIVTKSVAPDAQAQAREMILGREIATTPITKVAMDRAPPARSAIARSRRIRKRWVGRRMILGNQPAPGLAKIRPDKQTE